MIALLVFICIPVLSSQVSAAVVNIFGYINDHTPVTNMPQGNAFDGKVGINPPPPEQDGTINKQYTLICNTSAVFEGCTVEFLMNQKSAVEIRMINGTCYNTKREHETDICSCSDECNSFTWTFTSDKRLESHIFGCGGKVKDHTYLYRRYVSTVLKEETFHPMNDNIQQIANDWNQVQTSSDYEVSKMKKGLVNNMIVCWISLFAVRM